MAAAAASMASLARIFGLMKISKGDRDGLKDQCNINTVQDLVANRSRLAFSQQSTTCRLLVATIDFIQPLRLAAPGDDSQVHRYFESSSRPLKTSWEHFLATLIHKAMTQSREQKRRKQSTEASAQSSSQSTKVEKKFRAGDTYWVEQVTDDESEEDSTAEDTDAVNFGADSAWELDNVSGEVCLKKAPNVVRIPLSLFKMLYPYQREGVAWIAGLYLDDTGGILGDQMGMGKTIQTLTFVLSLLQTGAIRNALVVCPKSNVDVTWVKEAMWLIPHFKWTHEKLKVVVINQQLSDYQRRQLLNVAKRSTSKQPHLVITSYPQVQKHGGFNPGNKGLSCFDYIVLDEAHRVKNTKAIARKNLEKIGKHAKKLILTGTPFLNDMKEVHSLLHFVVGSNLLGSEANFNDRFRRPIEKGRKPGASTYEQKKMNGLVLELQAIIKPHILMRKKTDYLRSKLKKSYQFDVWTRLSTVQRELYQQKLDSLGVQEKLSNAKTHQTWALPAIRKLRDICNHPLLVTCEDLDKKTVAKKILESMSKKQVVAQSPKLRLLLELLHQWRSKGFKALVFSESTRMLNIIEYVLSDTPGISTCRIDGQTSATGRKNAVEEFNRAGSKNVMLLSIQAGGEGLTLTGANKSILFDPSWNQAKPDQAAARIDRPGQERETECLHFVTAGTVEEKMVGKQIDKGMTDRLILGGMGSVGSEAGRTQKSIFDKDELTKLFTLEPDGKCESLELFQQSQDGAWTKKCSTSKADKAVIGISQRSKVYKDKN